MMKIVHRRRNRNRRGKELKDARDNYLAEQTRLRLVIDEQQYNKEAAQRAQDLLRAPPF